MNTRKTLPGCRHFSENNSSSGLFDLLYPELHIFSHRHDMTLILRDLSFITPSLTNFWAKEVLLIVFGLSKPLLRYSMIFPSAD